MSGVNASQVQPEMYSHASLFTDLPVEILSYIFRSFLSTRDVLHAAGVCRAARAIVTSDIFIRAVFPPAVIRAFTLQLQNEASESDCALFRYLVTVAKASKPNHGFGIKRRAGDRSRISMLPSADCRGSFCIRVGPGNESVAWLTPDRDSNGERESPAAEATTANLGDEEAEYDGAEGGKWWDGPNESLYWERRFLENDLGPENLRLKGVYWLDVLTSFRNLPFGKYTLSFHVKFNLSQPAVHNVTRLALANCKLSVEFVDVDGETTLDRSYGSLFAALFTQEEFLNRWLRLDVMNVQVPRSVVLVRVRLTQTDGQLKSGMMLARYDAVPMQGFSKAINDGADADLTRIRVQTLESESYGEGNFER